ncbi:MAG TPA: VTT domain-containing protein [Acidobacteriota bacterium]|nr:VTT domain-containing protein [Acidobacteriota bacterium]HQM63579.1 VTT domain-containing protein [Acidobacteriota bacterium]
METTPEKPDKPFYRRKRFWTAVIVVGLAVGLGFNYKAVKRAGHDLVAYAEQSSPVVAGLILGVVAIGDSSFLSIPEGNDFLIVYFSILKAEYMPYFVLISAVGSVIGSVVLFSVGRKGGGMFLRKRFSPERVTKIQEWFRKYGIWAILLPCIVPPPMPFKLFVLTAGVLRFRYSRFILATLIGRLVRYGIWGVLAVIFRDYIIDFMKYHLLDLGLAILGVIILAGVGSFIYTRIRRRSRPLDESAVVPPSVE